VLYSIFTAPMNNRKHYAAAVSAFTIWGFLSLPLRALKGYGAGEILYFRILFSAALLLSVILIGRKKHLQKDWSLIQSISKRERNMLILVTLAGGLLLTTNWLTFIYVINAINIKTASFSYFICPVITAVLGHFLLKEELSRRQWAAVTLCLISCVLIGLQSTLELGYSIIIAITYALYLVSQKRNVGFDRMTTLCAQVIFAFLVLNIFYGSLVHEVPAFGHFYLMIVLIAGVFTVLPLFLNLFALNKINSTTVGILLYINPLMNFGLAIMIFGETITTLQLIGYLFIIAALILFNFGNLKKISQRIKSNPVPERI
jgi:chloramphenicol-sensitive protein RarD